jgi:hypothetical protein
LKFWKYVPSFVDTRRAVQMKVRVENPLRLKIVGRFVVEWLY